MGHRPNTRRIRHDSELGRWEVAFREPDPRLRPYVQTYAGFDERGILFHRRRELAIAHIAVIFNTGPAFRISDPRETGEPETFRGAFVGGLYDSYVVTEGSGASRGVQVNFTPVGAHLFLGLPLREVAQQVVDYGDLGPEARRLEQRLGELDDWDECFDLLDVAITARIAAARPPWAGVAWAWDRLCTSHGTVDIGSLSAELGCSRKHLIAQFREQAGLPPKSIARILRFQHAVGLLQSTEAMPWAELAFECGYYDQSHLIRDFNQFAGSPPSDFLRRRLPEGGGMRD